MAKQKEGGPVETVGASVPHDRAREIEQIAATYHWTKAFFSGKLLMRGLAAFRRDGLLDEPVEIIPASKVTESNVRPRPKK